jgi:hypothetical protein
VIARLHAQNAESTKLAGVQTMLSLCVPESGPGARPEDEGLGLDDDDDDDDLEEDQARSLRSRSRHQGAFDRKLRRMSPRSRYIETLASKLLMTPPLGLNHSHIRRKLDLRCASFTHPPLRTTLTGHAKVCCTWPTRNSEYGMGEALAVALASSAATISTRVDVIILKQNRLNDESVAGLLLGIANEDSTVAKLDLSLNCLTSESSLGLCNVSRLTSHGLLHAWWPWRLTDQSLPTAGVAELQDAARAEPGGQRAGRQGHRDAVPGPHAGGQPHAQGPALRREQGQARGRHCHGR